MTTVPEATTVPEPSSVSLLSLRGLGVVAFTLLTGLGANVSIPMQPLGVPFTLQSLAVVMSALMLGPGLGSASMGLYVIAGMVGVPLFADGEVGLQVILGQTGGYLLGFIACQPVITSIIRRRDRSIRGWLAMITAVLAGHAVIFGIGVPWLYVVRLTDEAGRLTWWEAVHGGFVVFIPGMIAKTIVAVALGRLAAPWASRRVW